MKTDKYAVKDYTKLMQEVEECNENPYAERIIELKFKLACIEKDDINREYIEKMEESLETAIKDIIAYGKYTYCKEAIESELLKIGEEKQLAEMTAERRVFDLAYKDV